MRRLPGNPRFRIKYDRDAASISRWDVYHQRGPDVPMISLDRWQEAIDWVNNLDYARYVAYCNHVEHFYCKPGAKKNSQSRMGVGTPG